MASVNRAINTTKDMKAPQYTKLVYAAVAKTEDGIIRTIFSAFDKCNAIEIFFHDLAACYIDFEVINVWRLR